MLSTSLLQMCLGEVFFHYTTSLFELAVQEDTFAVSALFVFWVCNAVSRKHTDFFLQILG